MPITVLIADDHQLIREGLKALLEREGFAVVGEASNGREALKLAEMFHPEVAVLDLAMPVLNGIDTARQLRRASSKTKTILLSVHDDARYILDGLRSGVKGYLIKTHAVDDLVRAIRAVARGGTYLSFEVSKAVVQAYQNKTELSPDPLSSRQRQVLQLIAEGQTTKEIATTLDVTVKTAETYRTRIMGKLDIHNTATLVRYAVRRGLIQP